MRVGRRRVRGSGAVLRVLVALVIPTTLVAACSSGSKSSSAAQPTPSAKSTPTTTPTPSPSTTPNNKSSPSSSGKATPKATPSPCHARIGSCLTVRSDGDAVNVRRTPNTKGTIIRTISSGYQAEILCVGKGQAVDGPQGHSIYWDAVEGGWISDAFVGASGRVKSCR